MASNGKENLLSFHTFCLVTGASKGLGRCMTIRFASKLPRDSLMLLMARSSDQLLKTKALIEESTPDIKVKVVPIDLTNADAEDLEECLNKTFEQYNVRPASFEQGIIVHNAASMGDVSKRVTEIGDKEMLVSYYNLNLVSMILLNNVFLKHFNEENVKRRLVIHISSICALQPFKTWSIYCAGRYTENKKLVALSHT